MKYLSFILVFTVLSSFSAFCNNSILDDFDYYRITTNYNGSAYNGSSIIVYGDAGMITISNDGGNNWLRAGIDDSLNIMSIINIGKTYFGVTNKCYIIKSTDDGFTWQKYYIANDNFYKILTFKSNLYCLSRSSIIELNQNIEKIKEYSLTNNTNILDFAIANDNIYYTGGIGKINKINLFNDSTTFYNLLDLGISNDSVVPSNLICNDNIIYFKMGKSLYSFNGSTFETVYQSSHSKSLFAASTSELFELYNINNDSLNLDFLYFNKIDTASKSASPIIYDYYDRYISALVFTSLSFLSKDTLIAVGKDKLIYMSYNRGSSWELKSHLNSFEFYSTMYRINDKEAVYVSRGAKFVKTSDGGITWLPQKNYNTSFSNYLFKYYWNLSTFYSINEKQKFAYYWTDKQDVLNFAYTDDDCETVILKGINEVVGYPLGKFLVIPYNGKIFLAQQTGFNKDDFTYIFCLNTDVSFNSRWSYIDSALAYLIDNYDDKLIALVINFNHLNLQAPHNWTWDSIYVSLVSSTDAGKTWQTETDLKSINVNKTHKLNDVIRIKDNIFISAYNTDDSTNYFYKLNLKTLQLTNFFRFKQPITQCKLSGFDSKLFVTTRDYNYNQVFFEFDDIENFPNEYKSLLPAERYKLFDFQVFNDSLVLISANDSLGGYAIWFAKPKASTNVVKETQTESDNSLYLSTPFPIPSNDFIRVKLYWDQRLDIEKADFEVYNSMGAALFQKDKININIINNYSGYITWDCKEIETGVYFINVKVGSHTRSVPVIVVK